jgi:hypothetical protein
MDDDYDNNFDDEHEVINMNKYNHIPGPAGEIYISDDHLNNAKQFEQKQLQYTQIMQRQSNKQVKTTTKKKKEQEDYERNLLANLEKYILSQPAIAENGIQWCKAYNVKYMKLDKSVQKKVNLAALVVKSILRYDAAQAANVLLSDFYKSADEPVRQHQDSNPTRIVEDSLIEASIHKGVIDKYPHVLNPGALLLLKKVTIYHPSPRTYHLVVTVKNIVNIFVSNKVEKQVMKSKLHSQGSIRSNISKESQKLHSQSSPEQPANEEDEEEDDDQQQEDDEEAEQLREQQVQQEREHQKQLEREQRQREKQRLEEQKKKKEEKERKQSEQIELERKRKEEEKQQRAKKRREELEEQTRKQKLQEQKRKEEEAAQKKREDKQRQQEQQKKKQSDVRSKKRPLPKPAIVEDDDDLFASEFEIAETANIQVNQESQILLDDDEFVEPPPKKRKLSQEKAPEKQSQRQVIEDDDLDLDFMNDEPIVPPKKSLLQKKQGKQLAIPQIQDTLDDYDLFSDDNALLQPPTKRGLNTTTDDGDDFEIQDVANDDDDFI